MPDQATAGRVLAVCAAFDQRRVGDIDAYAWSKALDDPLTYEDARDAVIEFYNEVADRRIMPADINKRVKDKRTQRTRDVVPPPPPSELDDEPRAVIAWQRAYIRAIGDGLIAEEANARADEETGLAKREALEERPRPVDQIVQQTADRLPRIPRREEKSA
jgi:hypothetical protein